MAVTVTFQNHTRKLFLNKEVDFTKVKVMLRTGDTSNATFTTVSQFAGTQVSGNGWTAGGELIASLTATITSTNEATLDGANIAKTATGGSIGPMTSALIIDSTNVDPTVLFYVDFGGSQTAGENTEFQFNLNALGLTVFSAPA